SVAATAPASSHTSNWPLVLQSCPAISHTSMMPFPSQSPYPGSHESTVPFELQSRDVLAAISQISRIVFELQSRAPFAMSVESGVPFVLQSLDPVSTSASNIPRPCVTATKWLEVFQTRSSTATFAGPSLVEDQFAP